jgi:hypothetical protein
MLRPVLARCLAHNIRIVSNFGAANPIGGRAAHPGHGAELGLPAPRIAVVAGDDLSGAQHEPLLRAQLGAAMDGIRKVSANAYIGAEAIAAALDAGAQIVVAGRVADPSLTVGPAMSHFGWRADDWDRLARATMAGHLLECGAQVCGGYFADPGYKDVPEPRTTWATPSPKSTPTATASSARRRAPAAWSAWPASRSSCSMKSTTLPPT